MTISDLENAALRLDHRDRARLAQRLLESLDQLSPADLEALWLDEVQRRSASWDRGEIQGVSAEDVLREIDLG